MAETKRIVVLGKTGSGKSSLGNTLFGNQNVFVTSCSPNSETKKCQSKTGIVNGQKLHLVDTPGLFDTDPRDTEVSSEIFKCMAECAPGPHAFLIVLKIERYTMLEKLVIDIILKYFSEEALKFTTVVFTRGDDLPEGMKIDDWVKQNESLNELVQKCGGRCHVFDNKYWKNSTDEYRNNTYQVQELIKTIDNTVTENGGKPYSNKMLQKMGDEIQQEMKQLEAKLRGMPEEEIHKKAKQNVLQKLWSKIKGYPVGIVLGALLGVGVMVTLVYVGVPCVISGAVIGGVSVVVAAAAGGYTEYKIKQLRAAQKQEDEKPLVPEEERESDTEVQPEEKEEMKTQAMMTFGDIVSAYTERQALIMP